ncbi:hypothetical protein FOMPIDRAFT_1054414 [Fomitopsis schrenkii]|uniref:Uncharacterized protein n=1 Tax=Fomitopsis schrenkii TaxID=2126942 RepID=S8DP78_FOMSC|nr:hypothetical protein FOMPIDRAFT_1054414 [Fomitopsis schrenkii]
MTKRTSTPYPRLPIEQLIKAEEEDVENKMDDCTSRYRRQLGILVPKPQRGREVFAEILNKEWELTEGGLLPESTNKYTVEANSKYDGDCDSLWGSPLPGHLLVLPLAQPAMTSSSRRNGEPRGMINLFGLSAADRSLVARYASAPMEEACSSLEQMAPGWTGAVDDDAEYRHSVDDCGGLVYPEDPRV